MRIVILSSLVIACGGEPTTRPTVAPETPPAAEPATRADERVALVAAELIADRDRVAAGQPLTVAVALEVASGYHIYWTNPGETGLPTEVKFAAPPGFTVGPARFPGPARFESTGKVVGYGYAGELLVSSEISAPAVLPPGPIALSVAVDYLACQEDECVPGKVAAEARLEAAAPGSPTGPAASERIAEHATRLPRPLSALAGARVAWIDPATLEATALAGSLTYFPSVPETPRMVGQQADGARLRVSYKPGPPLTAAGVLAVTEGDVTRYYQLDHPNGGPR